ncbi:MAG: hypothetical protein IT428_00485, partial [Planctomycetaceae bacterium]|nr:hypothetical protein [Planctomycetaceae bacterium]
MRCSVAERRKPARLLKAVTLIVLLWGIRPAEATDRYYFDREVTSENGAWRVTAKSPDNAGEEARPFASRFRLEMVNTLTGRSQWVWNQTAEDSPPVRIRPHDSGTTIVWNASDELFVVDAKGKVSRVLKLDDAVPEEEREQWIHWTTAGDSWSGLSFWYFCPVGDELYFVIRTYWDRRIIANVTRPAAVKESPALAAEFDRREQRLAMKSLQRAGEKKFATPKDEPLGDEVVIAAYLAGKHKIREAIPLLHQMDAAATYSGSSSRSSPDFSVQLNEPRTMAQLSLRRLGATPAGYPATFIRFKGTKVTWDQPWRAQGTPWLSRVDTVRA